MIDEPFRSGDPFRAGTSSLPAGHNASSGPGGSPTRKGERPSTGSTQSSGTFGDARAKLGDAAQQIGSQAKEAAVSLASEANRRATGLMDEQLAVGVDMARQIAQSLNGAASELDRNAPQAARLIRGAAEKIEDFSDSLKNQSVADLVGKASDLTRRQPALVFGIASVVGFALFRLLKSKPNHGSQSYQSARADSGTAQRAYHGA